MNSDNEDDIMDPVMQCITLPSHSGFSQKKLVSFVTEIHTTSMTSHLTPKVAEALLNVGVITIDRLWSDHNPILLHVSKSDFGLTPFKLFHSWLLRDSFDEVIKTELPKLEEHNFGMKLLSHEKFCLLKARIKQWHSETKTFDHVTKHDNLQLIKSKEEKMEAGSANDDDRDSRIKLLQEVDILYTFESFDLFQKARVKWDIEDLSQIKEEFLNFFDKKFNDHDSNVNFPPFANSFGLCALDRDILETPFSLDEVKNAVWDCGSSKAPGPDSPTSEFTIKRSLRQGDPLSPFIFILVMKGLHNALFTAISSDLISGVKFDSPKVFYLASSLKINIQKSNVYGIGVLDVDVSSMASNSGCASRSFPFTYLGLPIGSNMSLTSSWQVLLDRLYRLDREKDCLIIDRIDHGQWHCNWPRPNLGAQNSADLLDMLFEISFAEINEVEDTCVWSLDTDETFSVKDARCIIDSKTLRSLAPLIAFSCPSCNGNVESSNHIFFECNIAKDIWMLVRKWCDIFSLRLLRMSIGKVGFLRCRWLKRSLDAYQLFFLLLFGSFGGSAFVILIVSKTLSRFLQTSSSVFPLINRSWPLGSIFQQVDFKIKKLSGEASSVREALYQVAAHLHDNPLQTHNLHSSSTPNAYPGAGALMGTTPGAPIMGISSLVGAYGGYKPEGGDWSRGFYPGQRDESAQREFSLRLICPAENIGGVIGKGGAAINQVRQETRADINVNSSVAEGADDCIISISSKEVFEDTFSPAIEAALRLQPRSSERVERDSNQVSYTTRLLVPASRIGCLIGKGGSIISDMRRISKANIRIISKDDLPKVAEDDDEMVQITGELDLAKDALLQVTSRLRAIFFARKGVSMSTFVPVLPCFLVAHGVHEVPKYDSRDSKSHGRGHSYSGTYTPPRVLPLSDGYGSYGGAVQASVHILDS
ncbi:KH domain-containing protein [Tanacetum coccineum]